MNVVGVAVMIAYCLAALLMVVRPRSAVRLLQLDQVFLTLAETEQGRLTRVRIVGLACLAGGIYVIFRHLM